MVSPSMFLRAIFVAASRRVQHILAMSRIRFRNVGMYRAAFTNRIAGIASFRWTCRLPAPTIDVNEHTWREAPTGAGHERKDRVGRALRTSRDLAGLSGLRAR